MTATLRRRPNHAPPLVKRCTKCGEVKPRDVESFRPRPSASDGLTSWCSVCTRAADREYQHRRYHEDADFREAQRERRYTPESRAAERDRKRRRYHEDAAYREALLERRRSAEFRAAERERRRGQPRPDTRRRRALKANAPQDGHTAAELHASWEERGLYGCTWCHDDLTTTKMHTDHVRPLAKGGAETVGNLVPSCSTCNTSKGAMLVGSEWTPPTN